MKLETIKSDCKEVSLEGDGSAGWEQVKPWLSEHKPHTDGKCDETVTDDGARCLSEKPPTITRDL